MNSPAARFRTMAIKASLVVLAMTAVPVWAQEARTGVAHPEATPITATADEETATAPAKPSAAIPASAPAGAPAKAEVYGEYVPYRGAGAAPVREAAIAGNDVDGQIVTSVTEVPGELGEGTLLRARIEQDLSTVTSEPGTPFTAALTEPVMKDGRVVLPVGAVVHGRVTMVHSGRRISGAALLHLEAKTVDLPDGTHYPIHALLIDTDQTNASKVDREGSLVRRDHPKETLAAVGLGTGAGAVAGGMIGGGVGAAVGAGIGAGAGTVVWLKESRQEAVPSGALLVFSLVTAMPVTPERAAAVTPRPLGVTADGAVVGDLR